jgi:rhodanese-related sulfurtransferase
VREVVQKYGDRVRFIFRQYPLVQIHINALQAAEASECAAAQGRFWQAKDKLYDGQNDLTEPALNLYAGQLGLDTSSFSQCLSSHATLARIREDMEDAQKLGVDRTPTFFVDQQKIAKPLDATEFSQILDKELTARGGSKSGGSTQTAGASGDPASTGSLFPAAGGNIFASGQGSEIACSNDEALKAQPDLIRTAEARRLFEGANKPLFVDVRTAKEFAGGHLPNASNIPVDDFERRWTELPKDRTVVLYESGKSPGDICGSSRAAGRVLLAHGYAKERVKVFQDGLADWQKAGLPIAR